MSEIFKSLIADSKPTETFLAVEFTSFIFDTPDIQLNQIGVGSKWALRRDSNGDLFILTSNEFDQFQQKHTVIICPQ